MTYELDLPLDLASIHSVFYVSILKNSIGDLVLVIEN